MENKGFRITIVDHIKTKDHVDYVIRIIKLDSDTSVQFLERYSNLKTLHDNLRKETPSETFPRFPPKKFFGSTDEKFLNQRQTELNVYFDSIFKNEEFSKLKSIQKWIGDAFEKASQDPNQNLMNHKSSVQNPNAFHNENEINEHSSQIIKKDLQVEINIDKIKEEIDQCSKQFIDMGNNIDNEGIDDEDKVKEYEKVIENGKCFNQDDNAILFIVDKGKECKVDVETFKDVFESAEKKLNKWVTVFNGDVNEKVNNYKCEDLIISI
jgi:hypothetical protein